MPKDKKILMKLRRDVVNIMCNLNPKYKQHVRYKKWRKGSIPNSAQRNLWLHQFFIVAVQAVIDHV